MDNLIVVLLLNCLLVNCEKRVLLHGSTDVAQELLLLKSEFEVFKTEISALKKENAALKDQMKTKTGK